MASKRIVTLRKVIAGMLLFWTVLSPEAAGMAGPRPTEPSVLPQDLRELEGTIVNFSLSAEPGTPFLGFTEFKLDQPILIANPPAILFPWAPPTAQWVQTFRVIYCLRNCAAPTRQQSIFIAPGSRVRIRLRTANSSALASGTIQYPEEIVPTLPDRFSIDISDLAGQAPRLVLSHPFEEMSHPRVSKDGQWITFTRYHRRTGTENLAEELGGYMHTEIMRVRIDGTNLESISAPNPETAQCNSTFADNDASILFLFGSRFVSGNLFLKFDVASRQIRQLPSPPNFVISDPHQVGNVVAFPASWPDRASDLWMMQTDGSGLRQLTRPSLAPPSKTAPFATGDYDPRISPDGSLVAFMRNMDGGNDWRSFRVDIKTGAELALAGGDSLAGVPDWSGDGRLLIYTHLELDRPCDNGLYTMNPDGSGKQRIELPRGQVYFHPAFFSGDGSGPTARIVYSTNRNPLLRVCVN